MYKLLSSIVIVALMQNVLGQNEPGTTTISTPFKDQSIEPITSNDGNNGTIITTTAASAAATAIASVPYSKSREHISEEELNKLATILKVNQKKIPTFKKFGRKINSLIDRVNANDGKLRPELLVQELLPDPLPVKDIEIESNSFFSSYEGKFTNVLLHGISGIKITSIKANVGKFTAKIAINVPNVYLTGNYKLDGSVTLISVAGEGNFRMNISDIEIDAFGNLNRTIDLETGKDVLQIGNIDIDVSPGDMDLQFENLSVLDSENLATTIVDTMSGLIFSQVKYSVLEKTSNKIRARINERLRVIPIDILEGTRSETLFDDLLHLVTKRIGTKIEPLRLPFFSRNFAARMLILNVNASINIHEGKLYGLTTFARTGDIFITYEDDMATIEADVGFRNLTGSYDWSLQVLGRGPSGSASLAIRKIAAYMRIKQELKRGSVPKLEQFRVEEIDHVWMDMNGLGVWDHLLELVVNTVSNVFRVTIANLIASTVTKVIQEELDGAKISFIP
ncbi:hypothetical protein BLOT_000175 [Blomia tropicalis]|nr:hypothetical protein BLOT_000175 [Blomia tropicalis]